MNRVIVSILVVAMMCLGAGIVAAQQGNKLVETIMSSLSAKRSVQDSNVIPAPEPMFGGVINSTASRWTRIASSERFRFYGLGTTGCPSDKIL